MKIPLRTAMLASLVAATFSVAAPAARAGW